MADEAACAKVHLKYENKTNHNIVLEADVRLTNKRKRIRHRTRKRNKNKITGNVIFLKEKKKEPEEPKIKRQKREVHLVGTTHRSRTQKPIIYKILPSDEEIKIKVENLDNDINDNIGERRKKDDENSYVKVKKEEGAAVNNDRLLHPENLGSFVQIKKEISLNPFDIDAYWLPSRLNRICNEALVSQEKTTEVLEILKDAGDDRECENRLLLSLGYNGFNFVKQLIKLRHMIAFCTMLASSQLERQDMKNKMNGDPALSKILRQLEILEQLDNAEKVEENDDGCQLPNACISIRRKEYEEVHIPAVKPEYFDEKLVPINELPKYVRPAFANFKMLNRIQSRLKHTALESEENILLCAPTGTGKTNFALLCIMGEIEKHINADGLINLDKFKIIYVVPRESQVQEMVDNLRKKLELYNLTVSGFTGSDESKLEQIEKTQIIVYSSQKSEIFNKKGGKIIFTFPVRLIIIDDINLVRGREGPFLTLLTQKKNNIMRQNKEYIRLVGLTANSLHYRQFAACLRIFPRAGLFYFNNRFRRVPLELQCIGVVENNCEVMDEIVYEKIIKQAGGNQVIIFTHSYKQTEKTANVIQSMCSQKHTLKLFLEKGSKSSEVLRMKAEKVKNQELKKLLPCGFAIHHARMKMVDRTLVEELFVDKHIQVLFTDNTLNWGVQLLANTIIIRGTKVHNKKKDRLKELGSLEVLRMLERAGQPQCNTKCEGILITNHNELQNYLSLLTQH